MRSRAHAEPMSKLAIAELVSEWVQLRHAALQSAEMRGGWESHRGGREQEVFILLQVLGQRMCCPSAQTAGELS